jgi:hypothetical protein
MLDRGGPVSVDVRSPTSASTVSRRRLNSLNPNAASSRALTEDVDAAAHTARAEDIGTVDADPSIGRVGGGRE